MPRRSLAAVISSLVAACTFGLGEYAIEPIPASEGASETGANPAEELDGAAVSEASSVEGGPCTHGATEACQEPDGDAGICQGARRCVHGAWSPCEVTRKCPGGWPGASPPLCRNVDAKGDSPQPRWQESPMVGAPVTLWALTRKEPFELYGQTDAFCFTPRQMNNCYATGTAAVEVKCEKNQLKLSGNDFEDGWIHKKEICIKNAGAWCNVVDNHGAPWSPPAAQFPCERWFELVSFKVEAAPRCSW